uniref:NS3 n=1 Tax=uncultured densovirus TaxID=748192 RepID=A0A7M4CBJ7_9VIRU|nr:NS3 [uncultured densovirus]
MCPTPPLSDISDEELLIAAPWEAVPDEPEVQAMLTDYYNDWETIEHSFGVDIFWPAYLKEWGWRFAPAVSFSESFNPPHRIYNTLKFLSPLVNRHDFCLNYNEGMIMTPYPNFRVHNELPIFVTNVGLGSVIRCEECQDKDHIDYCEESGLNPGMKMDFHAWYTCPDTFMDDVLKNELTFFCTNCDKFLYNLTDDYNCAVCDNVVVENYCDTFTSTVNE